MIAKNNIIKYNKNMGNIRKKRLFIALNLPQEVKNAINDFTNKLKKTHKEIRWISSEGLHITLHFLGELNEQEEDEIKISLQSLDNQFKEMEFETGKISAFPNINNPRVVYLACKQINGNSIEKLQKLIGFNLVKAGTKIDKRKWGPHITIGRVKEQTILDLKTEFEKTKFKIASFEIMEAFLKPTGAEYKEVAKYNLISKNE